MIREQIAERIQEFDNGDEPLFMQVADSSELDECLKNRTVTEGCFVIKLESKAQSSSDYYQRITEHYQVVTLCQNLSDSYGQAVGEMAEQMQRLVFKALSGFCPLDYKGEKTEPLQFVSGRIIELHNGLHIWSDVYQLSYTQAIKQ